MNVAILKYNAGNSRSVKYALDRLGASSVISSDPEVIRHAERVIIPGVGAAGSAMQHMRSTELDKLIRSLKQPVLGICLGMQLLCRSSEEDNASCLGIIDEVVLRFRGQEKVPHTGWNQISALSSPLMRNVAEGSYVYFVHSFYVPSCAQTICETDYMQPFSAGIQQNNFYGLQFHPEKSGVVGETILQNFLKL